MKKANFILTICSIVSPILIFLFALFYLKNNKNFFGTTFEFLSEYSNYVYY